MKTFVLTVRAKPACGNSFQRNIANNANGLMYSGRPADKKPRAVTLHYKTLQELQKDQTILYNHPDVASADTHAGEREPRKTYRKKRLVLSMKVAGELFFI